MSKTLTLHNTNEGNGEHWYSRQNEYGKKEIDGIIDPEGGNTKEPPTSIPSPFARFDLVRTAFAKLSQSETLDGEPNDKRLVSECFDVGQIFFNYDKLKDKVKIIKWDKAIGLESLKNSPLKGHKRFGNALDLFIRQDGGTAKVTDDDKRSGGYNFDFMDAVYILRYTDEKDSGIIGGTSPSTFFFSSPNDMSFVNIQFGNDKLFDKDLCPLHKRDVEYQKFWHGLSKQPNFMKHFPEVSAYLKRSLDLLKKENNMSWQQIGTDAEKLTSSFYNDLFEDLVSQSGDLVTALDGFRIKKVKVDSKQVEDICEFIIPSEKYSRLYPNKLKPMILQNNYQGRLIYSKDYWNKDQFVPSFVTEDWRENKRILPGQPDFYPWLTVSDFLEPNIIRLVYPVNNDCFFNGGLSGGNELTKSYLLPLKKDFFDFFDVEDLTIGQGRKVGIKMENLAGETAVKVTLSIPMKVGQPPIIFERVYKDSVSDIPLIPDENKRDGGSIVELQFGVNLMPFLRIESEGYNPLYKVQLVDRDIDYLTFSNDYNLKFINKDNQYISTLPPKERSKKKQNFGLSATTKYYSVENNFDYLSVEVGGKKGIIIPRFDRVKKEMGSEKFTFAVDFGTTNTHIEYKTVKNTTAMPLEINKEDNPIATLHDPSFPLKDKSFNGTGAALLADIIPVEMIPERIGKKEKASFPTRTALLENSPKWSENLYGFMDFNPAFLYEKQNLDDSYNPATNLKWSNYKTDDRDEKRVEGYIQSLLILIRNKVLLNGGNLEATELVWFYPLSMLQTRRNYFEEVWNKHYQKIITNKNYPQRIPESTAPFYWFAHGAGRQTAIAAVYYPAVCVDIGGGTSDVVIFEDEKPVCLTSFRFAANAIFGDAFAQEGAANRNGFVLKYEDKIKQLLNDNGFQDLIRAYDAIRNRQHSEDIIAFFFSLQDNKEIQKKTNLNFNDMLAKDDSLKIIFLIFYTATVYHIAKIMKIKNFKMPRYLAFSGNGSKVLRILSNKTTVLAQLAKLIFEKVYEIPYHEDDLEVIMDQDSPKEVTCKGGLKRSNSLNFDTPDDGKEDELIEKITAVLIGSSDDRFGMRSDTYEKIDENILSSVAEEVRKFIDLLFTLNDDFNFKQKLNVNTSELDDYKKILLKDLAQNLKIGFSNKKAESDKKDPVEETLFFYPLIKGINNLATEIAK